MLEITIQLLFLRLRKYSNCMNKRICSLFDQISCPSLKRIDSIIEFRYDFQCGKNLYI